MVQSTLSEQPNFKQTTTRTTLAIVVVKLPFIMTIVRIIHVISTSHGSTGITPFAMPLTAFSSFSQPQPFYFFVSDHEERPSFGWIGFRERLDLRELLTAAGGTGVLAGPWLGVHQ